MTKPKRPLQQQSKETQTPANPVEPAVVFFLQQLKNIREQKDNSVDRCCDHPLCTTKLDFLMRCAGPQYCPAHSIVDCGKNWFRVDATEADLMPDDPLCSRVRCTEYLRDDTKEHLSQFLFFL